jgi:hypothetical protein
MSLTSTRSVRAAGAAGLAVVVLVACSITIGPDDWDSLSLGVPFRQQEGFALCSAACVQMWRLYCGWPNNLTQAEIYLYLGGLAGVRVDDIAYGVNNLTCTSDAIVSRNSVSNLDEEIAKQITSIDGGWPVVAITSGGLHAVLIDGGEFHSDSTGHYWWDTLLIHDPLHSTGDWPVSAAAWIDPYSGMFVPADTSSGTLQQVVRSGAVANAYYYLGLYGGSMSIWDDDCAPCIEYQD